MAGQMIGEPFEILKTAKRQVTGQESKPTQEQPSNARTTTQKTPTESTKTNLTGAVELDREKSRRRIEAHRRELESIKSQKTFEELQKRISEGEDLPIENFSELSMEQKQVLRAQIEAVKTKMQTAQQSEVLIEPTSKRKKGVLKGMAGKLDKMKRKSEIRMGPSG